MIIITCLLCGIWLSEKFFKTCYNWCVLVYILIQFCITKLSSLYRNTDIVALMLEGFGDMLFKKKKIMKGSNLVYIY